MLRPLLLPVLFFLQLSVAQAFQAPLNDNCANASVIAIPNGGFALGNFFSDTVAMNMATMEPGEALPPNITPSKPVSVWFEFFLPTNRTVRITFGDIPPGTNDSVAMAVYKDGVCLPNLSNLDLNLSAIDKLGYVEHPCVGSGLYRIQVLVNKPATKTIYLILNLQESNTANVPEFDLPAEAYSFGTITTTSAKSLDIACHSIDGPEEYPCLPVSNPTRYNKSAWFVFRFTNPVTDLFRIRVTKGSGLPDTIAYRLFEGDCRSGTVPLGLPVVYDCGFLEKTSSSVREIEHPCLLKPNTWYSFELIFPQDFGIDVGNGNITVLLDRRGANPTAAPRPLISQIPAPSNKLGVLPQNMGAGATTNFSDNFSCNGRMALNDCGAVNPATGVDFNSRHFDIATFATFELSMPANVTLNFQTNFSNNYYPLVRLFAGEPTDACNALDPVADLVGQFQQKTWETKCLPAGKYTLQVLGSVSASWQNTANTYWENAWDYGHLGLPFTINITVQTTRQQTDFSLRQPGDVDFLNGFSALLPFQQYNAQPGLFGCDNTVLPAGSVCYNREKMMVREWQIGDGPGGQPDSGAVMLYDLAVNFTGGNIANPPAIRYRIFSSSLHALANTQNAHLAGEFVTGAQTLSGCIPNTDSSPFSPIDSFCFCAVRDTYALVGFGDTTQINYGDQPKAAFQPHQTLYFSRALAENLGDITALNTYTSGPDYFSCLNNPATIAGSLPCASATKMIYREFYISEPRVLDIQNAPGATGWLRLFKGRASDPAATLSAVLVPGCFSGVFKDDCTVFQPGWYTLISYGFGPGYDNPIYNNGSKGDVGKLAQVMISSRQDSRGRYNRPWKAYDAGITNWKTALTNDWAASTDTTYILATDTFACFPDTPFSIHPILPCSTGQNRFAYYVFRITEPSFVAILNVPTQYHTEVFDFDVRTDSARMLTATPVYPCATTQHKQLCNLQPGTYTLVVFADYVPLTQAVSPRLYVERAGHSRFDHAALAYDFDRMPGDSTWRNGRISDSHPVFPSTLAPSHDIFFCTTGAKTTDPPEGRPSGVDFNPNVYNPLYPYVLFTDNVPAPTFSTQKETWRNLWMTFVLTGSGNAQVRLDLPTLSSEYPAMVVYESDVNGSIPFSVLKTNGGLDSTLADGLTVVTKNFTIPGSGHSKTLSFSKNGCLRDTVRYYLVLTMRDMLPNVPVAVSILYDEKPTVQALYDLFPNANVINNLQETGPPYTPTPPLGAGTYIGAPFVLNCATRSPDDPYTNSCYTRSVWYKIEVGTTGKLRYALDKNLSPATLGTFTWGTHLYREITTGNPAALVEINTSTYSKFDPQNPTGYYWEEGCVSPGVYYLFFEDCFNTNSGSLDIHTPYRPYIWIVESPGDFCTTAVTIDVPAAGVFNAGADVECHTIGEGYGENGSAMGCLDGPTGHKSTWFKITITGNEKLNVTFQLNLPANVTASLLSYRLLYGSCPLLAPGPCNADGGTIFTLNCLTAGDYYIQLVSPQNTDAVLGLRITSVVSVDQNCIPINPVQPFADFAYVAGCDSVLFQNTSTAGPDIQYQWLFPGVGSSTAKNPVFISPGPGSYPVTLIVRNTTFQTADTTTQIVAVPNIADSIFLSDVTCQVANAGVFVQSLSNQHGCDSVVTTTVTLQPAISLDIYETTCDPTLVGMSVDTLQSQFGCDTILTTTTTLLPGNTLSIAATTCDPAQVGTSVQTFQNQFGCDSVVTTTTTLLPGNTLSISATTCDPAQVGTSVQTFQNQFGCDSIVTTTVALLPAVSTSVSATTCDPASAGVFVDTLQAQNGCDSIVTTTVALLPAVSTSVSATTCDPASAGVFVDTLQAQNGCDSVVTTTTTLNPTPDFLLVFDAVACGANSAPVFVQPGVGLPPFSVQVNGVSVSGLNIVLPEGPNLIELTDANGCVADTLVDVALPEAPTINLPTDTLVSLGQILAIEAQTNLLVWDTLEWEPLPDANCPGCLRQEWSPMEKFQTYTATITDLNGCTAQATMLVRVLREVDLYVPNVFRPDDSGRNDRFVLHAGPSVAQVLELLVFDRWGDQVYLWDVPVEPLAWPGWDGRIGGQKAPPGVYVFAIKIRLADGSTETVSGDVSLIR